MELSPAERRKNWWHYHKWPILAGAVLLIILTDIGVNMARQFTSSPDYRIAYVEANALPDDTAHAIENNFAALGEDLDGNGKIQVKLTQYVITPKANHGKNARVQKTLAYGQVDRVRYANSWASRPLAGFGAAPQGLAVGRPALLTIFLLFAFEVTKRPGSWRRRIAPCASRWLSKRR